MCSQNVERMRTFIALAVLLGAVSCRDTAAPAAVPHPNDCWIFFEKDGDFERLIVPTYFAKCPRVVYGDGIRLPPAP